MICPYLKKLSFLTLFSKFLADAFYSNDSKRKFSVPAGRIEGVFSSRNALEQNSESLLLILFHGTDLRVVSLPRNGVERNSESLLLLLLFSTKFRAFFSYAEWFGTEFREFSVLRYIRNSVGTNQLVYFVGNSPPPPPSPPPVSSHYGIAAFRHILINEHYIAATNC
jgi:hypothetical protein